MPTPDRPPTIAELLKADEDVAALLTHFRDALSEMKATRQQTNRPSALSIHAAEIRVNRIERLALLVSRIEPATALPESVHDLDRQVIDRDQVMAAVRQLGYDPAKTAEVVVRPHNLIAMVHNPDGGSGTGVPKLRPHRMRIKSTPVSTMPASIAEPGPDPVMTEEF